MRTYETTFIINPQADDSAIDRQVKNIAEIITKSGGTIAYENRMGTRRLAYDIDGLSQGYYTQLIYQSGTEVLNELDLFFKLEAPYVRYMTVIYEGKVPTAEDPTVPTLRDDKDREDNDKGGRRGHRDDDNDDRPRRPAPAPRDAAPVTPVSETAAPEKTEAPAPEKTEAPAEEKTEAPKADAPAQEKPADEDNIL